jgi:multidrug efflux pump subunit AcrB
VPEAWYQVRKKVGDIRHTLPQGVLGPFINDEFGDTFITIYALTGDGFDLAALRDHGRPHRPRAASSVPDVKKVELFGEQAEKIYIEVSHAKLATLGLNPLVIFEALRQAEHHGARRLLRDPSDRVRMRVSGDFESVDSIREIGIEANGRLFRLGDIATVVARLRRPAERHDAGFNGSRRDRHRYRDAQGRRRHRTRPTGCEAAMERLQQADLPVGIDLHVVADQPQIVRQSIDPLHVVARRGGDHRARRLLHQPRHAHRRRRRAVDPLVLAVTFLLMYIFGIDLQRISLGALVIALGLLVDDAIIAVEMMVVKMEQGWDRFRAATFAYTSTAFPMLTGTLITAVGFMPVGLAKSGAGEYTFSIFAVVSIALLVSWVVAVVFTPFLGYLAARRRSTAPQGAGSTAQDRYEHAVLSPASGPASTGALRQRWLVIASPRVLAFAAALAGLGFGVQKQFFPASSRPELLVDLWLPNGASLKATEAQAKKVEAELLAEPEMSTFGEVPSPAISATAARVSTCRSISNCSTTTSRSSSITTHDIAGPRGSQAAPRTAFCRRQRRLERPAHARAAPRERPAGRFSGHLPRFRRGSRRIAAGRRRGGAAVMRASPHLKEVNFDWNETRQGDPRRPRPGPRARPGHQLAGTLGLPQLDADRHRTSPRCAKAIS